MTSKIRKIIAISLASSFKMSGVSIKILQYFVGSIRYILSDLFGRGSS